MSFDVAAGSYDRFMGRYSTLLAPGFADFAAIHENERVLDVGCGPGALTRELLNRSKSADVSAIDPSESFVAAARERHPGVTVQQASAEHIPFDDAIFDAALAQLVVHFMADPIAGLREMARVTRSSGVVAACVWDFAGRQGPLSPFWAAARQLEPGRDDESDLAGAREGHLAELFHLADLRDVEESALSISVMHQSFEEWWDPYTLGVGPAGKFAAGLDELRRTELRELCRHSLPEAPFLLTAKCWAARGRVA